MGAGGGSCGLNFGKTKKRGKNVAKNGQVRLKMQKLVILSALPNSNIGSINNFWKKKFNLIPTLRGATSVKGPFLYFWRPVKNAEVS